jgi:hypothetical protein
MCSPKSKQSLRLVLFLHEILNRSAESSDGTVPNVTNICTPYHKSYFLGIFEPVCKLYSGIWIHSRRLEWTTCGQLRNNISCVQCSQNRCFREWNEVIWNPYAEATKVVARSMLKTITTSEYSIKRGLG